MNRGRCKSAGFAIVLVSCVVNREIKDGGCENEAQEPKRQGSSNDCDQKLVFVDELDADGKQDLAAQRSSQAHLQCSDSWQQRCGFQGCGTFCACLLLSWATAGFLALAFACFPCRRGWDGGMKRGARVPVPACE